MDPTQPSTPQPLQPAPQPPKRPMPKGVLIAIIAGVVIILGILIWLTISLFSNSKSKNVQNATDTSTVITRPGYEDVTEDDGIADATALTAKLAGSSTSFEGKPVLQPCGLITLEDLKSNGLLLTANSLTGPVMRNSYTGQGTNNTTISSILLPSENESNSCRYSMKRDKGVGTIAVTTWQSFEISERALQEELRRSYSVDAEVAGLRVYKDSNSNSFQEGEVTYIVRAANASAQLRINVGDDAVRTKLLTTLAERQKAAESTPMQSVTFEYKSPTMDKPVYTSCETLSDAQFKQIVGLSPGRLTEEKFASATGLVEDPETKELYNYATYDCRRTAATDSSGSLTIQTRTYETEKGAASIFAIERTPEALARNVQPVAGIGDEAYYGDFAGLHKAIAFRKGRVVVLATYSSQKTFNQQPPETRIAALRPFAEATANSLADF